LFSTKGEPLLRILTTRLNGEWYLSAGLAVFQTLKEWYLSAGLADKICLNLRPESGTFAPEYPAYFLINRFEIQFDYEIIDFQEVKEAQVKKLNKLGYKQKVKTAG
jgi:hypothetical protein